MSEMLADIIAEMRVEKRPYGISIDRLRNLADRIEAAAEREREAAEARQLNECVVVREEVAAEWRERIGNVAAMRLCDELIQAAYDADICSPGDLAHRVRKIKNAIGPSPQGNAAEMHRALDRITRMTDTNPGHLRPIAILTQIGEVAEAALAAPARNCDVGTAVEQSDRFARFCECYTCCSQCPIKALWNFANGHKPSCGVIWAQMPYAEGGAE